VTLAELKVRFPKSKFEHEPTPDCTRCGGTGVKPPATLKTGTRVFEGPCPCVFFGPNTGLAMGLLRKVAQQLKG